jgi:hypothetical protein
VHLPLVLAPRRSRRLDFLLLAFHLLAFAALLPLALPGAARAALAALVLASLFFHHAALGRQEGCVLRLGARGVIELTQKLGADEATALQGGRAKDALLAVADGGTVTIDARTALLPGLIVLVLRRREGGRVVLPLLTDSVGGEDFRRLRLWLNARPKNVVSSAA